jgi:hypothetical protein
MEMIQQSRRNDGKVFFFELHNGIISIFYAYANIPVEQSSWNLFVKSKQFRLKSVVKFWKNACHSPRKSPGVVWKRLTGSDDVP